MSIISRVYVKRTESIDRVLREEGRVPEETWHWFASFPEARAFHCPTCGAFQFNRQHRIVAVASDGGAFDLLPAPVSLQCQKCGHVFHIHIT